MRLSKLYSNKAREFGPIHFREGLNVVLGEIRLQDNLDRDTHNLGKSTLGKLLDFCLLKGSNKHFFLFANPVVFDGFEFFLEIEIETDHFITIKRSVHSASKISFIKHKKRNQNFSKEDETSWTHGNVPFARAKQLLDGWLNWQALKPWDYRKIIGYLLRAQEDYQDVFQLGKFSGKHSGWKPFLSELLGFDGATVAAQYNKEAAVDEKRAEIQLLRRELGDPELNANSVDGLLLLKRQEVDRKQAFVDNFDFREQDKTITVNQATETDKEIAELNQKRYATRFALNKVSEALEQDELLFKTEDARSLFEEAGILFEGQIKRDFDQLVDFNRAITEERRMYLLEEKEEHEQQIIEIDARLSELGDLRASRLKSLSETDAFERYKQASADLVQLKADIENLSRQKEAFERIRRGETDLMELSSEESDLHVQVSENVRDENSNELSKFNQIRLYFSEIVESVIDRKALLNVEVNKEHHLEFTAEILGKDGNNSSAGSGHTYMKLLCIAFDLAVLRAHIDFSFPRFVYHDGLFESLDDRKKTNLIKILRQYCDDGVQSIVTLIDSDLPSDLTAPMFADEEIILRLHDEGPDGRLFRMPAW